MRPETHMRVICAGPTGGMGEVIDLRRTHLINGNVNLALTLKCFVSFWKVRDYFSF